MMGDLQQRLRSAGADIQSSPPRFDRVMQRAHRRMLVSLVALIAVAAVGAFALVVAGALGRSLRDPNFRLWGVDTRAAPCTGSILANVPPGRRTVRLPAVMGRSPTEVSRALTGAGLRVLPYAEISGRCIAARMSPALRPGARLTRATPVIIRFRPAD